MSGMQRSLASRQWQHHPCLACSLPDCDEGARACGLRAAMRAYEAKRKRGEARSEAERFARAAALRELYGIEKAARERAARAVEKAARGEG